MTDQATDRLRAIKTFPSLVKYLRDELEWPIESDKFDDLTFEYQPEELGLDAKTAVKIKEIKQLRPLSGNQPWGIFFINFEPKTLPVIALRRILSHLVIKKRKTSNSAERPAWAPHDLLFISSYGETDHRDITFAQFSENANSEGDLPALRVLSWDDENTVARLEHTHQTLREKLHWPEDTSDLIAWRKSWSSAFTLKPSEVVNTSKALAVRMAELATTIRKRVNKILEVESEKGPLRKLHASFKEALIHDLKEDDFADMYAQTITYGLLSARVSRPAGLIAENIADMVPVTNPFLRDLLSTFLTIGGRKGKIDFDEVGINEVVQVLREANMEAVLRDFGDRNPQEDPVVHFYELFLKEYDPKKRMQRGVFYTPRPVVSYIVRSVDEILRKEFGLADGLADTATWGEMKKRRPELKIPDGAKADDAFVQILDPATGTGTFLVEVIDIIHKTMVAKWTGDQLDKEEIRRKWNEYVSDHLLPRLYGFELMMAPYAVAHMKIGLKLGETGYNFQTHERARIYLTNALEPAQDFSDRFSFDVPALANEAQAVNAVKAHNRFTVVIGNPPYAVSSHNKSPFIETLLAAYKAGLERERNIQPLSDDYIKFICFAQHLLDVSNQGILGFITNHSYLSGVIHRTMRKSLLATFDKISVTDLHGNSFINEHPPGGIRDSNVFEIQQGVSLFLGCKKYGGATVIRFSELWGIGEAKLTTLSGTSNVIMHTTITPDVDYAFFVPKDFSQAEDYLKWPSLADVFRINQNGVQTGHDGFSVTFDRKTVTKHIEDFFNPALSNSEVSQRYDLGDNSGWSFSQKRQLLRGNTLNTKLLVQYFYRPFDLRYIYYDPNLLKRPSPAIMPHLIEGKNMALFAMRKIVPTFAYSFFGVINGVVDHGHFYMGNQGSSSCFPLYLQTTQRRLGATTNREHNFQSRFCEQLFQVLQTSTAVDGLPVGLTPEDIFHYIYSVFHSPSYRTRYAEFLKIDFPRLPLTGKLELFRALAHLGGELVALHLLESPQLDKPITKWRGITPSSEVEKITYSNETVWIDKDKTTGFQGVPEAVWNFHIGGYQVCEKWLKDRKGRKLSKEDITHYQKIVVALNETIRLMKEIDEVIEKHGGWPGAFLTSKQHEAI